MSKLKRKSLILDFVCILFSIFLFLYISPSQEVRPRLIYIMMQTITCLIYILGFRWLFGIYREYFHDLNGRNYSIMYMQLIIADMLACVSIYITQILLPNGLMRINLVRVVCISMFNLMAAIVCRLCYQSGMLVKKTDRRLIEAVEFAGMTTEEAIDLITANKKR